MEQQDIVVCEICGSGSRPHLILNCAQCNAYEHGYCLQVTTYDIPREWYCADCQKNANGVPKPSQGAQMELQKSWHGSNMMKEREAPKLSLNQNNTVHQINPKYPNRFGNAKVKLISSEEVVLLSRERPSYVKSRFAVRTASKAPTNTKHLSNLKCTSTSRSDTQVQALERCGAVSQGQIKIGDRSHFATQHKQIYPPSPNVKQPSNMKSISPSRSDIQVQTLKHATASHDQANIVGRPNFAKQKSQVHPTSPHLKQLSNMKRISPNKVDMQVHGTTQSAATSHDQAKTDDINMRQEARYKSAMDSLCLKKDVLLTIDSSVGYSRRPAPAIFWTGFFHVKGAGKNLNLGEFKAQFPSKVSSKVYDIVKLMPRNLQLELLPRMDDWPKSFETICPGHEDIGLFFFSNEPDGCEKKRSYLLEDFSNYVLRTYIDDIKLLIYSSEVLPSDSQWIDGENYLWGVFVASKGKSDPR